MAQKSLDLIEAMRGIAEKAQPITERGVGYKLFTAGLISSMERSEMKRVYRLLKEAREQGDIPWKWIVDETRELEIASAWQSPDEYTRCVINSYRRDYWQSGLSASWSGPRKAPCAASFAPCSMHLASVFRLCTASAAPPRCMVLPMTTTADR
jgi:hypothetical protein